MVIICIQFEIFKNFNALVQSIFHQPKWNFAAHVTAITLLSRVQNVMHKRKPWTFRFSNSIEMPLVGRALRLRSHGQFRSSHVNSIILQYVWNIDIYAVIFQYIHGRTLFQAGWIIHYNDVTRGSLHRKSPAARQFVDSSFVPITIWTYASLSIVKLIHI